MLRFSRRTDDHEAWLGHRYADLLRWAQQIAGDQEQAEDLVHDLFVQFMASRPDLGAMENADGYLYTSLRNLHLSNARRAARRQALVLPFGDFDVLDYDSLRSSVRAIQERRAAEAREQFQEQLWAIWRYTQVRKTSSKRGSVLMLRFFHGYYPEEIALLLRISRGTLDQLIRQARAEARRFVAKAAHAGCDPLLPAPPGEGLLSPPDFAKALHDAALRSDPDGRCLGDEAIAALYPASGSGPSVATATLAHLVSCRGCLGRATRHVGLSPLADRHPLDSLGYDRDGKPPDGHGDAASGPGAGRARRGIAAGRRRLTELLAHEPKELRVAINGVLLGSQQVTSAVSRLMLQPTLATADFVEVFSEHDVRLLFLSLDPPPRGPVEARQAVAFEGGRRLEVHVSFAAATPLVSMSYVDPARVDAPTLVPRPVVAIAPRSSVLGRLRRWIASPTVRQSSGWSRDWRPARTGALTTLAAVITIGAVLLNPLGRPTLSAAEALQRSSAVDASWQADRHNAIHRVIDLTAQPIDGGATTRRRVEVWHSAGRGMTVRRAYDERSRLVAGEWIGGDGSRIVHRSALASATEPVIGGRDAWRVEPSADEFRQLVDDPDTAAAREDGGRVHVMFEAPPGASQPSVLAASLTLHDDWRVVEQTATVRTARGTMRLTWTERNWTVYPAATMPAEVFDVDDSLMPASEIPAAAPVRAIPIPIPVAGPGLEVAALAALRTIDADLGGEVRIRRSDGRLHIAGVLASPERRAQVRAALAGLTRDPRVDLRIETVEETLARPGQPPVVSADVLADTAALAPGLAHVPEHERIRRSLLASGVTAAAADDEAARFANRLVRQASRMRVYAWALRNLLEQIPGADVDRMDASARAQWRALVVDYSRGFLLEAEALRALMAPIAGLAVAVSADGERPDPDESPRATAIRLVDAAAVVDGMLEAAFTLSEPATAPRAPFDPRRFAAALALATSSAAALEPHAVSPSLIRP